jgi:transcription termination factor NusB
VAAPGTPAAPKGAAARAHTAGRRDALTALYESDFGLRTALAVLDRRIAAGDIPEETLIWSRPLLEVVEGHRPQIDATIERLAPAFPLATMAKIDRSLLRCGLGEVIHSRTAAPIEAIAAWTALARTYSGEPARKLVNGVLGTALREVAATAERDGGSNS